MSSAWLLRSRAERPLASAVPPPVGRATARASAAETYAPARMTLLHAGQSSTPDHTRHTWTVSGRRQAVRRDPAGSDGFMRRARRSISAHEDRVRAAHARSRGGDGHLAPSRASVGTDRAPTSAARAPSAVTTPPSAATRRVAPVATSPSVATMLIACRPTPSSGSTPSLLDARTSGPRPPPRPCVAAMSPSVLPASPSRQPAIASGPPMTAREAAKGCAGADTPSSRAAGSPSHAPASTPTPRTTAAERPTRALALEKSPSRAPIPAFVTQRLARSSPFAPRDRSRSGAARSLGHRHSH